MTLVPSGSGQALRSSLSVACRRSRYRAEVACVIQLIRLPSTNSCGVKESYAQEELRPNSFDKDQPGRRRTAGSLSTQYDEFGFPIGLAAGFCNSSFQLSE